MKTMITGGTGFIGSRLALAARARGDEVRVLAQANNRAEASNRATLEEAGVELVDASVTDADAVREAMRGVERVIHLAAAQHEANVPDEHFRQVNVEGTRNLLDAALECGVARFVHGSTIGVYGEAMDGQLDEDSPLRPSNIYGVTKLEGERLALSYADRLPVAVVRISETYGPGDRRLLKLFKAIDSGAFFMIGPGRNIHQLVYVDDLVEGLFLAAEREEALGRVVVLAGSEKLTTDQMVAHIAEALGRRPPRLRMPLWPFMAAAWVLEGTLRPLGIQPPLHRRRMDFFRKSFYFDQALAERLLGYRPAIGFAEGARRTAEWYRSQGLL